MERQPDFNRWLKKAKKGSLTIGMIKPNLHLSSKLEISSHNQGVEIITKMAESLGLTLIYYFESNLTIDDVENLYGQDLKTHLSSVGVWPKFSGYLTSGPVLFIVFEGDKAIEKWLRVRGNSAKEENPSTGLRSYKIDDDMNLVHGADSVEDLLHNLKFLKSLLDKQLQHIDIM